ncbi:AI-2E family transporter [Actinobaculum sp. 352]|uniref:AI-2E family transporter n=1 Tax=Actinobaculum sp. 352 TaxID=2490946 RepID=UPI0013DFC20E|nr:AI-2E family transporter [Actinobaculum sp. 352]
MTSPGEQGSTRQAHDPIAALGAGRGASGTGGASGGDTAKPPSNSPDINRTGTGNASDGFGKSVTNNANKVKTANTGGNGSELTPLVATPGGSAALPMGLRILLAGALATVACAGLYQIRDFVAPAFFALTLVLTVRPIHRWLIKKGLPIWLSAVVTITTLVVTLLGVIGLMVWSLVGLPDVVTRYVTKFQDLVTSGTALLERYGLSTDQFTNAVLERFDVQSVLSALSGVLDYVSSAGSLIALLALALLFITIDTMTMSTRAKIVERHDGYLFEALSSFEGRVRQYWLVSTTFGAIVAVIDGIALQILNVPMAVAWALFSFITNYIPNIGFVIGVIPPALLGLLDSGWITAVWVIVAYSVINAVIQGIFQPKITGDAVGLSTTVTFLSLVFWTAVIGPLGAILAVPLTLFAKALLIDSSPGTRWIEAFLVPEAAADKKMEEGYYDEEEPAPDAFVGMNPDLFEDRSRLGRALERLLAWRETKDTSEA